MRMVVGGPAGETRNQPPGNRGFLPKRDLAGDVDYSTWISCCGLWEVEGENGEETRTVGNVLVLGEKRQVLSDVSIQLKSQFRVWEIVIPEELPEARSQQRG